MSKTARSFFEAGGRKCWDVRRLNGVSHSQSVVLATAPVAHSDQVLQPNR